MKSSEKIIIKKMVGYCDDIISFLQKFQNNYAIYLSEKILQYACNTCIIQIGELSTRLPDDFKKSHKEIPWKVIKATRNFYTHDYEKVDLSIMWQTLTEDVPALRENLLRILQSMQEESGGR